MMLHQQGVSVPYSTGDAAQAQESGGGGGGSFSEEERGRMEEGDRSSGGNRWPRQETIALLNIRSDMDGAFRDSSLKGPLWDEVSRKLSELGYHRSAKKCKEKFENVYKYHKRTKDGRTSKADGKTYRFFDQLEALDTHPPTTTTATTAAAAHLLQLPAPLHAQPVSTMPAVTQMPNTATVAPIVSQVSTVPSMSMNPMIIASQSQSQANIAPISINPTSVAMSIPVPMPPNHQHFSHLNMSMISGSTSSSSTSSDSEPPERRKKRKRKWKNFFGRLMKEVIDKQEELQMKFLDTLEKRERERMIREEAWRAQEIAKMNREHDLLVQERSIAATKDAAIISFLQKISEQQNAGVPLPHLPVQIQVQESTQQQPPQPRATSIPAAPVPILHHQPPPPSRPPQAQQQPPQSQPQIPQSHALAAIVPVPVSVSVPALAQTPMNKMIVAKTDNGGGGDINMLSPSPSRWPKVEVQALIKLRTTLDMKYQENGPKGPLWEEISLAMRKIGYNRNAKRCKEKWENINKYYKKVKESSKKRPEDSKTCPYFHDLDAIYRERGGKTDGQFSTLKPENQMAPIMAQPEQQWPLPQHHHQQAQQHHQSTAMDIDHENQNQNDDDEDDDEEEEEDEDEGGEYEIVTNTNHNNKTTSMATIE